MSKKIILMLTVFVLTFAPVSAYADDSISIFKSLVFQLDQQKIITDIFTSDSDLVIDALEIYMKYGDNKEMVDQSFVMLKNSRDKITDIETFTAVNNGILELEKAYEIAKIYRKYPSNQSIDNFFATLDNAHTLFYNQAMIASDLYFQIYNNIMNF